MGWSFRLFGCIMRTFRFYSCKWKAPTLHCRSLQISYWHMLDEPACHQVAPSLIVRQMTCSSGMVLQQKPYSGLLNGRLSFSKALFWNYCSSSDFNWIGSSLPRNGGETMWGSIYRWIECISIALIPLSVQQSSKFLLWDGRTLLKNWF